MHLSDATAGLNHWIEIDIEALRHNVRAVRAHIGPEPEIIAVVKANAYGHGATAVARALERDGGVARLAVAWVSEGIALRCAGVRLPILVLGHADARDAAAAVEHDLTITCDSPGLVDALSARAQDAGRVATIHVKVDTGLHRSGLGPDDAVRLARYASEAPGVRLEGLWTHMANADEADDSFSLEQRAIFEDVRRQLPEIPFVHAANSATALRRPELRYSAVRIGLAMYGYHPDFCPDIDLKPVLSLKARVARVGAVKESEGVSYGLTWRAACDSDVALVPVGYADGWNRALGNRGQVLIRGERRPMVGRVCMDQFLADATGAGAHQGDEVVLLGAQGDERIDAVEVAATLGTIPWEVLAGLQARIPRYYHSGGEIVCA